MVRSKSVLLMLLLVIVGAVAAKYLLSAGAARARAEMERWTALAQKVAGVVLVGVGVYFVLVT